MDANFWADVINNIFGAFALIFGAGVSSNIVTTLETVTSSNKLIPDPDLVIPFIQAIAFIAILMATPISLLNLILGALMHRAGYVQRAMLDFFGTYFIAIFGLTFYSILAWIVDAYNATITDIAKNVVGAKDNWFDGIMSAWNAAGLIENAFNHFLAQIGGWLLVVQSNFLLLAILPTIALLMLAFVLRDFPVARVFLTLSIATLLITLLGRAFIATWLAFAAWLFSWAPETTGITSTVLLSITLVVAGLVIPVLFVLFFASATVTRTKVMGKGLMGTFKRGDKAKEAENREDLKNAESARRRTAANPSTQPSYDASASPSVREKARVLMSNSRVVYEKGRGYYDSGIEKAEQTRRTAHTVVMVSSAIETAAPVVAVKFAAVPYAGPAALAIGVAASGTKHIAAKVESSASKVLNADQKVKGTFTDNG